MTPQPVQELTPHERRMQARDGNRPLTASAYESASLPEPMIESPLDNNPDLLRICRCRSSKKMCLVV